MPGKTKTHRQEADTSLAVSSFLQIAQVQAQLSLYRGFIHEVNNALGGVGTLAEALKGSDDTESIATNLDLIAHTTQKVAQLQQRMRSMYPSAQNLRGATNLSELIDKNCDLMELMVSRSQRIEFVLPDESVRVDVATEAAWGILALLMHYVGQTRPAKSRIMLTPSASLSLELLSSREENPDENWAAAFELAAQKVNASCEYTPDKIVIQFN